MAKGAEVKTEKYNGAQLILDDAFIPKHIKFIECNKQIEFFINEESITCQVYTQEGFQMSIRLPLYAKTAFAQMFTQTLNGNRLIK